VPLTPRIFRAPRRPASILKRFAGAANLFARTVDDAYKTKKTGVYRCSSKTCRKDFTVTTKSVMESSHIKLHVWLQAFFLMSSSKKGMSSHQLHRALRTTYKTAWFLSHRIREAMKNGGLLPMGGEGKIIESDETYYGPKDPRPPLAGGRYRGRSGPGGKAKILTLVERGGEARSFKVEDFTMDTIKRILVEHSKPGTRLMTDEGTTPFPVWHGHFLSHESVKHSAEEYARGDVTTNTVEGFFSIFKRGMRGVYQHCSEKHLHRYLAEFDFRYSNRSKLGIEDAERAMRAVKGAAGKRLMYRQPGEA
jgi:ISXO2-like transposase domain